MEFLKGHINLTEYLPYSRGSEKLEIPFFPIGQNRAVSSLPHHQIGVASWDPNTLPPHAKPPIGPWIGFVPKTKKSISATNPQGFASLRITTPYPMLPPIRPWVGFVSQKQKP